MAWLGRRFQNREPIANDQDSGRDQRLWRALFRPQWGGPTSGSPLGVGDGSCGRRHGCAILGPLLSMKFSEIRPMVRPPLSPSPDPSDFHGLASQAFGFRCTHRLRPIPSGSRPWRLPASRAHRGRVAARGRAERRAERHAARGADVDAVCTELGRAALVCERLGVFSF